MSFQTFPQSPLCFDAARKGDTRSQFGAICYRVRSGKTQILLITSRRTGRWIVPKGWPIPQVTPADTAATEAFEEAGVEGDVQNVCLGLYAYDKTVAGTARVPCVVALYPIRVRTLRRKFPERDQRKRKWLSRKRAAALVDEPELGEILARFDPRLLKA